MFIDVNSTVIYSNPLFVDLGALKPKDLPACLVVSRCVYSRGDPRDSTRIQLTAQRTRNAPGTQTSQVFQSEHVWQVAGHGLQVPAHAMSDPSFLVALSMNC